jgi:dihydropteroate synthase
MLIDVGCTPGLRFPSLGAVVRELAASGMRVSVDSFDPDEIRTAVAAGAGLVLSVNGSNIDVARDLAGTGARGRGAGPWREARHAGAESGELAQWGVPA